MVALQELRLTPFIKDSVFKRRHVLELEETMVHKSFPTGQKVPVIMVGQVLFTSRSDI